VGTRRRWQTELSREIGSEVTGRSACVTLLALLALFLAACGSTPSESSTSTTDQAGFPADYPTVQYPVSDPALPPNCTETPDQPGSSQIGSSHLQRNNGGVVEVTALVVPKATFPFAVGELGEFQALAGNCFYSAHVAQKGARFEMVFGFKDGAGPMDPSVVAHFLRLQRFALSSVTQK
jgi:hypothetical protein